MAKVNIEDALLNKYSDKELVRYITGELEFCLSGPVADDISAEAVMAMRLVKVRALMPLLKAVDKRMNGGSKDPTIVV